MWIILLIVILIPTIIWIIVKNQQQQEKAQLSLHKQEPLLGFAEEALELLPENVELAAEESFVLAPKAVETPKNMVSEPAITTIADKIISPKIPKKTPNKKRKQTAATDVVLLRILAKSDTPFHGYELLQTLLANGFKFGKMQIFHRHQQESGEGEILFSLASAVEPGTFAIEQMGNLACPGLTLFMPLNQNSHNQSFQQNLELMLSTAQQLQEDLGGTLLDQQGQPFDDIAAEKMRNKIKDFQKNYYTYDLLAGIDDD